MTFVSPLFLWALAAVAIPVIIHLFNFRRYKKVYFTNVKFLRELQQESKSKSRLKEILILTCRCLALACLVLAFCQPVLHDDKTSTSAGVNAVSIYIDNSFSMDNIGRQGPLLQIAKAQARELIKAFGNADKYQVITNDFEGRHQRFNTREDALNIVEEIKTSSSVRLLSDVLKRQGDFLQTAVNSNRKIFVLSDGQRSTFDLASAKNDTTVKTVIIPMPANRVNNVFIDTCWFETPLQQKGFIQKLHARIVNNGQADIDVGSAKLLLNKQQVAIASFSLEAKSKTEIRFSFESKNDGFNFGSIKIEDYPVTFDDELFFAFNSRVNVSVTLINGKSQPENNSFASLFKNDSLFSFSGFSEQTIDYSSFKKSDVIILNQISALSSGLQSELAKFTAQGGAVVIVPAEDADLQSYNQSLAALNLPELGAMDTLTIRTDKIEYEGKFYSGVFEKIEDRVNLPQVNKHFKLVRNTHHDFESILTLQNSDVFFGSTRLNNARLYLFSSPLNESATNFNKHALFVPTFYQLCFSSLPANTLFYPVSSNVVINVKNDLRTAEQPPHIRQTTAELDFIPELRVVNNSLFLYTRAQVSKPGFYEVTRSDSALLPLAFNYSRMESDLDCFDVAELQKVIDDKGWKNMSIIADAQGDISKQALLEAEGKKLWKLFIFLALLFIALEMTLLRLLK